MQICEENDISAERSVVGIDTLDGQNDESYGDMKNEGSVYIFEKNVERHIDLNIHLFTRTDYNFKIKLLLSFYSFMNNGGRGYPDGKSDCSSCIGEDCKNKCTKFVPYQKAYNPDSIGYDKGDLSDWKEGTYIRVHINEPIINSMRNWMGLNPLTFKQLYENEKLKA